MSALTLNISLYSGAVISPGNVIFEFRYLCVTVCHVLLIPI